MQHSSLILLIVCCASTLSFGLPTIGTLQSAAVRGRLLCNGKPIYNVKVKLWDIDTVDPDDLMAEGHSNKNGEFHLSGHESELTTIDPKLNIYHNCNDEAVECLRKIQILLPKDFVTEGATPAKTFDVGILNLSAQFPGETRDCIN